MTRRTLVVRLDSMGDVLICGPAVRAVATQSEVCLLVGPAGAAAASLLPGVADLIVWDCPWISANPPPIERAELTALVERIRDQEFTDAIVLTSFHQSALPTALLLRLAGIERIAAASEDYPGRLLDLRVAEPPELAEPIRMLRIVAAAGYELPAFDDGRLQVELDPTAHRPEQLPLHYLVVHPGAAAPARTCSPPVWRRLVQSLRRAGHEVVITGDQSEAGIAAEVNPDRDCLDLTGRLSLAELSLVLQRAHALVVGNTGPAHLAAAVGTPIVSMFAPVVSATRWAPFSDRTVLLGRPDSDCARSRARVCPVPGHPCLDTVTGEEVLQALTQLGIPQPQVFG